MFAEQEMLGQATVSIDQKKRIILPPFTYREEGDTLILINGYQENFVELMAYEKFCQLFQKIKDDKDIEIEHRPDRVITDGKETIVIDFKFGKRNDKYKQQVSEYMSLLNDMGHKNLKGFIWYVYSNKIEEVNNII